MGWTCRSCSFLWQKKKRRNFHFCLKLKYKYFYFCLKLKIKIKDPQNKCCNLHYNKPDMEHSIFMHFDK